jgi:glucokinase
LQVLAVDLGGGHARCAVVSETGIVAARSISASGAAGLKPLLPAVADTFRTLLEGAGLAVSGSTGVAFAFCGQVDVRTGADAAGLDLGAWSRETLGLPLLIENDARMALLGESFAGAGRGSGDLVMLTLGTDIGGVAMMNGNLLHGKRSQAGCLGGHFAAERCHAHLQFRIDLAEAVQANEAIDREAKAGEYANQQESQPQLQTPADGTREKTEARAFTQ